jgi:hypothetical protein
MHMPELKDLVSQSWSAPVATTKPVCSMFNWQGLLEYSRDGTGKHRQA